jgi:C4-dicarboxylate-binding protein DctP
MMKSLRFGGYQPERSVHTRAARALDAALRERTGGAVHLDITAQITTTGRLASDMLTMTESGELDLCYFASSYLAGRIPALGVLDLPFEGADRAAIWRRLDGEAGRLLKAAVARVSGYELLAFWDNGVRHISNGVRAIRHPRDCAGLSIRTLDNTFHQAIFAALGFSPRFIDVKDLGEEVRKRTIDAQENPLTNLINFDIHKTHRFVSLTGQFFGIALVLGNKAALGRLDAAQRATLEHCLAHSTDIQRELAAAEDEVCLQLLQADGVDVVQGRQLDHAAFQACVADVVANETCHLDPALLAAWREDG